jgi:hypothetical protein
MTTHDQPTVTGSQDDTRTAEAATPVNEDTASTEPEQPSSASSPALGDEPNPNPSSPPPGDPSASAESGAATLNREAPVTPTTKHTGDERESSSDNSLFADDELADLRARWAAVQAAFVDDPKQCVQKADVLVSDLVEQLTTGFANARSRLEDQWARGEEANTESLRVALMHYREFFERLLAV